MNIECFMSLEKISNHLGITPEYASACFKKHMGISLMKYSKKSKLIELKYYCLPQIKVYLIFQFHLVFMIKVIFLEPLNHLKELHLLNLEIQTIFKFNKIKYGADALKLLYTIYCSIYS